MGALSPVQVTESYITEVLQSLQQIPIPMEAVKADMRSYTVNVLLSATNIATLTFLFSFLSLFGVLQMFQLRRRGYFIYIAAQVALAVIPVLFGGFNSFGIATLVANLLWAGLWFLLYGLNLKHMA